MQSNQRRTQAIPQPEQAAMGSVAAVQLFTALTVPTSRIGGMARGGAEKPSPPPLTACPASPRDLFVKEQLLRYRWGFFEDICKKNLTVSAFTIRWNAVCGLCVSMKIPTYIHAQGGGDRRLVWFGLIKLATSLINQIKYLSSRHKWPFLCWPAHCWHPHTACTWSVTCILFFFSLIAVRF